MFYVEVKVASMCILLESTMIVLLMTAHNGHCDDDGGYVRDGEQRFLGDKVDAGQEGQVTIH